MQPTGRVLMGLAFASTFCAWSAEAPRIRGAGATFPAPIYAAWAQTYTAKTGVTLSYDAVGSGAGMQRIKAREADFGASDIPMPLGALSESGLVQFPVVIGGLVPVVTLGGLAPGALKLTGEVLAGIFLGRIRAWDDPLIRSLNPGVRLPDGPIRVVQRSDESGSTFLFTTYLSRTSTEWKGRVGSGRTVEWPVGEARAGSEGVGAYIQVALGSIGFLEYSHALRLRLAHARLQNKAGQYPAPGIASFQAATAAADWQGTPGYGVVLVDQPGAGSWPITGASFVLVPIVHDDPRRALDMLSFFSWCLREGTAAAIEKGYVPLPQPLVDSIEARWARQIKGRDGSRVWIPKTGL